MFLFFRALAFSLCLWLPISWAADSGWLQNPQNDHAQVRISSNQPENGMVRLLLDVKLNDGWKTYWRSPGEGGIAPEIKWQTPIEVCTGDGQRRSALTFRVFQLRDITAIPYFLSQ